ncbi:Hsp20/alpha crystallin family protein [Brachybacterium sp. p3-SID1565]|uniref:Hsp20/alpha crystallin family protein n=1 Tax=Brachybacterium epidermidis TaxID=2781983 RepID=A0ABR9W4R3_9MICO|nr:MULTISPECIES: Hsp20/alpha crystallin family protein [Brachybacterium]MBE9405123.1 Hsp20/alpha crystallin family protein [Brachybacterium epidermidis]MCT1385371.1 Hsp20/alpha crystallin family protein [Brachybacterium sp. p3-SID1565]
MARSFTPFQEVDRFFSDLARTPASVGMPMDLYREDDRFVAEIDLPGVDPASVDVDVEDRTLTVRAERKASASNDAERSWLTRERPTGTFARQLTLGSRVSLDRIEAEYSDGVLRLTIPMAEEAKPRKINVAHTERSAQPSVTSGQDTAPAPEGRTIEGELNS